MFAISVEGEEEASAAPSSRSISNQRFMRAIEAGWSNLKTRFTNL
jgi:hypothetical protein